MFDTAFDYVLKEWGVIWASIKEAPLAFGLLVVVLVGIIYWFVETRYSDRIKSLQAALEQQRSTNDSLRAKLELLETRIQTAPPPPPPTAATASKPDLKLLLYGGNIFIPDAPDVKNRLTGISLNVRIWNTGAPGIAIDWTLFVVPEGAMPIRAQLTSIPETLTAGGQHNSAIIRAADALDTKTIKDEVGKSVIEGVLLFYAPMQQALVLKDTTELRLSVRDAFGTETKATVRMGDWVHR